MRILPEGVLSPSLATRHGSVRFASEAILALSIQGPIAADVAEEVSQVVIKMEKARMYRFERCSAIDLILLFNLSILSVSVSF